jgi:phenylpyruvate tautomerase PptA (4-oxalocrotonate tautomerase family)
MIEGRSIEEKHSIADAVHKALLESFKIPESDRNIRIEEYKAENYILPPGKSKKYVLVEITAFEGRSFGAKQVLYKNIVDNFTKIGMDKMDTAIVVYDVPMGNWGIRGGIPACDLDLGFKVDV